MQHDKHKDRTTPQPAQTERATQFVDKLAGDVAELQELITSARAIINKAGNPETPKDTTISLEQWHDFYEWLVVDRKIKATTHHRDTTTSRYRKLCNFLSGRPLTRESFNEFISHMKDNGYSNNYMNNLIKLAKLLDRYHGINQLLDYSYFPKHRLEDIETLTEDDIRALATCRPRYRREANRRHLVHATLIWFLAMTGCRLGEALDLTWRYVYSSPMSCEFRYTKNGSNRRIPLPAGLYQVLLTLPHAKPSDYVFPSTSGGRMDQETAGTDLRIRAEIIGLKKRVHAHVFRHSYITEMIRAGVSLAHIARIVGHKDISTTDGYTHLALTDLQDAVDAHPLVRESISLDKFEDKLQDFLDRTITMRRFTIDVTHGADEIRLVVRENVTPVIVAPVAEEAEAIPPALPETTEPGPDTKNGRPSIGALFFLRNDQQRAS